MPMHNTPKTAATQAVALKYQSCSGEQVGDAKAAAPKVVAKGSGDIAQDIIALAEQNGIFIHQDEHLSEVLQAVDLGQEIPESMYLVIAELIAFSFVLQGKFPDHWTNTHGKIDFVE